ncbi:MAG TPA: HypC/HybG/HupF family hydrogenase formation chaperone [Planctomycetota bacterium]|nr:HypC/HybG/HupF family hydrogenase formation chaperone [Planctomycetota bacterium]
MCLAVPAKIVALEGTRATVEVPGNRFDADVSMVDVKLGDYVLVHAGFAIERYDPEVAAELLQLWEDVADAG